MIQFGILTEIGIFFILLAVCVLIVSKSVKILQTEITKDRKIERIESYIKTIYEEIKLIRHKLQG